MFDLATQILGLSGTFTLKDAHGKPIKNDDAVATATILHSTHPTHEKAFLAFGEALRGLAPEGNATESALTDEELKEKRKAIQATFLTAITQSIDGIQIRGEEIGKDKAKIKEVFSEQGLEWFAEQFFIALRDNSIFLQTQKKTKKG